MWIFGIVLSLAAISAAGGLYLVSVALRPAVERDAEVCYRNFGDNYPVLRPWADSLRRAGALRDTTIAAADGTRLQGWYVPARQPAEKTALLIHGYTDHPFGMLQIGSIYHRLLGYNLLLPALRYHGGSGGRSIGMGWRDREDVLRWIDEAQRLFGGPQRIVLHGISMGAATTMMVAGDARLPRSVRCFVEDCGYTSVWEQFRKELREDYGLPAFPLLHAADLVCRLRFGWNFREASALEAVARSERPMLFIHGEADRYVPTAMVYPLFEAKHGEKELWIAPGSAHAASYADHPESYARCVVDFVQRYMGDGGEKQTDDSAQRTKRG